jgi:type 1 glutamine amidotransferase
MVTTQKRVAMNPKVAFLAAFIAMATVVSLLSAEPAKHRLLLVTGEDAYHDWRATTPVLRAVLQKDPRLAVEVLSDLSRLRLKKLSEFAVVVLHFKNASAERPGREAFDNLRHFVQEGGGLVVVHFGCGAFEEFREEYDKIIGRVWFGPHSPPGRSQHDPRGPFFVRIEPEHPISEGLSDFTTDDELYTCLMGEAPIDVVASAVSRTDGKTYPMAFTHTFGKGRVFVCTLGHDVRALEPTEVGELFRRGAVWAAGIRTTRRQGADATR